MSLKMNEMTFTRMCKICQTPFSTRFPKSRLCSDECKKMDIKLQQRAKYFRRKARETDNPILKEKYLKQSGMGTKAFCDHCQNEFETYGQKAVRYCSEECKKEAKYKSRKRKVRECLLCHEPFEVKGQGGYRHCEECRSIEPVVTTTNPNSEKEKEKTVKELMEEYEDLKAKRIDPFFLSRGKPSDGVGAALTDGY